ncbi:MAG TPA: rRNA maturation RNase YbeY [Candidatus Limnocylindria bacterium]|nr:rRNA maturation RNase YbeY [Candidatus Limnocylindria bacterium]
MECSVTFHDHIGREQLQAAIEPMLVAQLHSLLESAVAETARAALDDGEVEVEVTLCSDREMTRLNFDHMGERGPTDVLAFPLHEWTVNGRHSHLADDDGITPPGPLLLGDVVLDVDQAVRQASEGNWSVPEELVLLTIHGCLHLLGHDHAELDEEAAMRGVERHVLAALHRRHRDVPWKPGSLFDRAGHAVSTGA